MQILKFVVSLNFMRIIALIMIQQARYLLMVFKINHTKLDTNILLIIQHSQWAG